MSAITVEMEKKKRAANSPLVGSEKEFKGSNIGTSPLLRDYREACTSNMTAVSIPPVPPVGPLSFGCD